MTINGLTGSVRSTGVPTTLLEDYTDYGGGGGSSTDWTPPSLGGGGSPYEATLVPREWAELRSNRAAESNAAAAMGGDDDDLPFFGGGGGGTPARPGAASLLLDSGGGHGTEPLIAPGGGHFDPPPWGMPPSGVPGRNSVPLGPARGPGGGHLDPRIKMSFGEGIRRWIELMFKRAHALWRDIDREINRMKNQETARVVGAGMDPDSSVSVDRYRRKVRESLEQQGHLHHLFAEALAAGVTHEDILAEFGNFFRCRSFLGATLVDLGSDLLLRAGNGGEPHLAQIADRFIEFGTSIDD